MHMILSIVVQLSKVEIVISKDIEYGQHLADPSSITSTAKIKRIQCQRQSLDFCPTKHTLKFK